MQFVLLLQVCLVGLGLTVASPGKTFLIMFPPHNDPTENVSHQVTIIATDVGTSVSVQVLESSFVQNFYLYAYQSKTIDLPSSVGMSSARSSHLLSVESEWPVTALASFCTQTGCDHSLLQDVSSWDTHYYPITPSFPNHTVVSQMVITSSDRATSVDVFLSQEVLFEGKMYPGGHVLRLSIGALQSVNLQSNFSLSGSELISKEAVGVVVGFTCSKHTPGNCSYGFVEVKPVIGWSFDYIIPPLVNTGMSSSFLLAMAAINTDVDVTTSTGRKTEALMGGVMKVIPVVTSDEIQITSDVPFQLVFYSNAQSHSTLIVLASGDDVCHSVPVFASANMQNDNSTHTDLKSHNVEHSSPHTGTDVGYYLSTLYQRPYPALCEKNATSCGDMHCGFKRKCSIRDGKPLCSLKTKICSAWGDSYYSKFDGRDLQGNCNYTLVQTTCPGLNSSVALQINIARAYLNSVSTIHTVQISIQGFNISIIKEDKNHVRINGQKRNLPLTLGNGSLNFYPSGSSVVLDTTLGLSLWYDWKHHLQVEVGPELYGVLCGLCGNAYDSLSDGIIASNGSNEDFTLPWVVNSDTSSCIEDCGGSSGVSCPVCSPSQTKASPGIKSNSLQTGCTLLQRSDGPFADCHSHIDPEPFVRSCVNSLCVNEATSSMCKILTAYANTCQRSLARVQNWRKFSKCPMVCPTNSYYESCATPCPATCANPDAPSNCSMTLCVESCICNRGYLLSGGECVPPSKCGCLYQGSYYHPKETFWIGEHCQEKCVCQPSSKKVLCAKSHCQDGEVCKFVNGVLGCHVDGPGMCIARGDPHYTTFDGRNFDVHGNCTYLLTSHCPTWGDLDDFRVEVQNQFEDASNVSFRHVKMAVYGFDIQMSHVWRNRVMVNGLLLRLPSVLSRGKVKLYTTGLSKSIETDFGVVVTYSSDVLTVQMPRSYSGNLCGLCGNFNANPEDDPMPDNEADITQTIGYWQTSSKHECVDVLMNTQEYNSQDIAVYGGRDFCLRLLDTEGAFQSCHQTVDPEPFYENCVHDLSYSNHTTLCQILASYVAVCQEFGAMVDEWRAPSFCNLTCPPNSEYRLCSSHMSDCVESPQTAKCKEGCFCKAGFFHSGEGCVPSSECGCIYNEVYYEKHENFYPDEHCRLHCVCVDHNTVRCTNHTCPHGTKCGIQDGQRACHASPNVKCAVMDGRHFRGYDGHRFDLNMGSCHYVLSQVCEEALESDPTIIIQQRQLHLRVHGVNITLETKYLGKVKIDGVLRGLPVQLDHIVILHAGSLTRVVIEPGVVVTYGGPNLIQIVIPAPHRKMCGLCGNVSAVDADDQRLNGSTADMFASSWSLSPSGTNCSEECDLCSACNSTMAAEFASNSLCGRLLDPAGSFSGCHSTVDAEPFFHNCVNDLCKSNGNEKYLCNILSDYTFACQEADCEVKPWRGEKCLLSCPENSHYNICVSACPKSCGILSDIRCPWGCYEGCQCESPYMQSGNSCVKAEECGCFYLGQHYEIGEISWTQGCSERCNCSAAATMCCEPASCPEGESCSLNNTWGCARKEENYKTRQSQCWVLGGPHFYTFDGMVFEFLGNCTYTLIRTLNDTSENMKFWVGVQNERTPNETSSLKAIHVKVAEENIAIYKGGKGYAWINGEKRLLPVTLQFGLVKVYQSGMFVVVDTILGLQVKYDCSHIAIVVLSNTREVSGMCGNNNGIKEDDLRTPQGEDVDATTFGWSWRVPDEEAQCTADCGDSCPRSAQPLLEIDEASRCISMLEYIWSPQNPFYQCLEVVNYTEVSAAVTVFDLCSSNDTQEALCLMLEAYAAACQNAQIHIAEWRNSTFCPISCQLNSHYESCGPACPATCEDPLGSRPCSVVCSGTCQCDSGFVLDGDSCVPSSQCGCIHNGYRYHSNQTFWADEGCTERCVCDPHTHQTECRLDSCGPHEHCALRHGVRSCAPLPRQTCMYTGHHIVTFDQRDYDFHGSCQYQLLGMCGQTEDLNAVQVHVEGDGHLESALHVLVNVSGVLVKLNSNNTESIEVDGVRKSMPYHLGSSALAFSLTLHTYLSMDGFELSLSIEGIVKISLSSKYANATCGLCGNFNSDPADDLTANEPKELLSPESFAEVWRTGRKPQCVEGCLGGSCPNCSSELLARFSDPEACGKILEVNGPFRHCHANVDPSSFYKRCVSDLCLHGGLQYALCHSLAEYAALCLSHKATVYAWRSPTFCHLPCPTSTSYSMSSASVHLCLGWRNNTMVIPNMEENCLCEAGLVHSGGLCVYPENCGCFHHGEYLRAGQEVSTCEQSCLCHAGGHVACRNVSCGEDEDCKLIRGVQGCHPRAKVAHCSVDGSQYTTFDGQAFEFHGSCNYTLVQTCLNKWDVEPVLIAAQGNHSTGRQIYLQVNKVYFKTSTAFPGKIEVNGVYEKLPFSQSNITVHQKNGWITIKTPQSVELISDLQNHIVVKIPDTYRHTTCGLCGNYNADPSDDLQLPNGTAVSDPVTVGSSWKLFNAETSCSDTCSSTCQLCLLPKPEYTSDQYCGFLTHPSGQFSSCHHLVSPQKYYSFCLENLCVAEDKHWALCDALWTYDAACKEAGGVVDLWMNTTRCSHQCVRMRMCQPETPYNCTITTGLHFNTFDGHHFDFRDSCSYSLVQTKANLTGLTPFNITISDASCHKRLFHSLDLKLSIYGVEVVVRKDHPGKVLVGGVYTTTPYSHPTGHISTYSTPLSIVVHTDVGLQLIVYNTGTLMVILPSSYGSSVSGLCGNANADPHDDLMMPNEELAQNRLEFAHSWRSLGAEACRSNCSSRLKRCPVEAKKLFEGSDFCGVLLNELGPFADCASALSPQLYFHVCVIDSCSYDGHYSGLCNSIASYAAACQAAQLPVRHWRSDTFCGMSCPKNSHYELCGPRCPVACLGLSSLVDCSGGCEEGCQCDPGYVLSDGQCVLLSDCGCMHEGQYRPAGHFVSEKSCQECTCREGEVTCSPMEGCSEDEGLALQYGVCQVFAGFGYITFDGVILPHYGACTYVLSALSSNTIGGHTVLLSFKKGRNDTVAISKLVFRLHLVEVSVDPETIWKIQVNGEEYRVPFDNGELKAYQEGHRLIIITPSGVALDLSSTQYLRLTVPQAYDATSSGLCGNFNGEKYDDLELKNGNLTISFAELLQSWAVVAPGLNCTDTCGRECHECVLSPHEVMVCDMLLIDTVEFHHCWNGGVDRNLYTRMCARAVCGGAGHMAACLAVEAYSAACQAKGISVGSWRENSPCALQCPDSSSPSECVDSSSNSCPALLQSGSAATSCSEGCECHSGNVFDGGECVPYSQCGCVHHDTYIKVDGELYTEDCMQKCWCHPLGGVICEEAACGEVQHCTLRNGSWGCHDRPDVCELRGDDLITFCGQQLSLETGLSQNLMSLCDKTSAHWFSLISYHGACDGNSSRLVAVFHILVHGSSFTIQEGIVKVNGLLVSLPHISPSGVSVSSGVNQKSEVVVILRKDAGMESELEMEIGVTMVAVKVPVWYSGKLCGLCGNVNDLDSHSSVRLWVLPDFPGCGFTG